MYEILTAKDLDVQKIRVHTHGAIVGTDVIHFQRLCSTMDEAACLAEKGSPEGLVVIADEQTGGRGRFDRVWIAPKDSSILLSVILRPTLEQHRYINMAATLAVCDVVEDYTRVVPYVKWPNDVMVGDRKISGILVESEIRDAEVYYSIVGIGLNVKLDPSKHTEIEDVATSIMFESGDIPDMTKISASLLERLDMYYRQVKAGKSLTSMWSSRIGTLGSTVTIRWKNRLHEGYARGVDEQGNLLLDQADGSTIVVVAGEVTLRI